MHTGTVDSTGGMIRSAWRDPGKHTNVISSMHLFCCANKLKSSIQTVIGWCEYLFAHLLTCPPAAQAATNPYCPPSFCSRCATVVTSLQPVAPNGCPRDREPPHRLNFSMGGVPTCAQKVFLQIKSIKITFILIYFIYPYDKSAFPAV